MGKTKLKDTNVKIKEKIRTIKNKLLDAEKVNKVSLCVMFGCFIILVLWGIVFKCNFNDLLMIEEKRAMSWDERFAIQILPVDAIFAIIYENNYIGIIAYFLNFFALVPFGFLLGFITDEKRSLLFTFFFILGIEIFQFFSYFGVFDIADIMLNVLGAFVGFRISKAVMPRLTPKMINTASACSIIPLVAFSIFAIVRTVLNFPV